MDTLEEHASCERLEFLVEDPEDPVFNVLVFVCSLLIIQVIRVIYKDGYILQFCTLILWFVSGCGTFVNKLLDFEVCAIRFLKHDTNQFHF